MPRDKNKTDRIIKQGEEYITNHPEVLTMTLDELVEHFNSSDYALYVNWSVMSHVVVGSLRWSNYEDLVNKLASLDVVPLVKEYVGYLLYQKRDVDLESLLLLSDKMGVFDKLLVYVLNNLIFQREFHQNNVLGISLLINRYLRTNTSVHNLMIVYSEHIMNYDKETVVIDILMDIDFEFKNEILSRLSCSWIKKSKDDAFLRMGKAFETNNEERIKTVLYLIKASYDKQSTFEYFYKQISCVGEFFPNLRGIIVFLFASYIADTDCNKSNIYKAVLKELKVYSCDNKNKNDFLRAIQYRDEIKYELIVIFEEIISYPVSNDEALELIDAILYNIFKQQESQNLLDRLVQLYTVNDFNMDFERFIDLFSLSFGLLQNNDMKTWEYIQTIFSQSRGRNIYFAIGVLFHRFKFDSDFIAKVKQSNKELSCEQICRVLNLLQYTKPIGEKICTLYLDLAPFCSACIDNYISFGLDELYESYPTTLSNQSARHLQSDSYEIKTVSNAIIEYNTKQQLDHDEAYKIKDFLPSNERQRIIRKIQAEQNQKIKKLRDEKSSFLSLFSTVYLKYGNKMGFITRRGTNATEYSSQIPVKIEYEYELPKKYLIDPVGYYADRKKVLSEVIKDEVDN